MITRAPDMPPAVEGMVSLRGKLVPVIDLAKYAGISVAAKPEIMIVTEFNGQTQGLLVEAVDTILRIDWSAMRVPPHMLAGKAAGLVTAVTELADGRLVMMLDVEQLLAESATTSDDAAIYQDASTRSVPPGRTVLFADDSSVARNQIARTLDALSVQHIAHRQRRAGVGRAHAHRRQRSAAGRERARHVQLVLTDIEMPEMDGYMLAKRIKADARFKGVPVIMHSSLSGALEPAARRTRSGIDEYVSKFEPAKLAAAISRLLA